MDRTERYREIAETVAADLAENPEVEAVVLVGSTAIGHADEHSDVDLEVVGDVEAGQRSVEDVHVEWTPIARHDLEAPLEEWTDDSALYTYAQAELLYDAGGFAAVLARYDGYPPDVRREKLYAGWFYGSGDVFDAHKAHRRGDTVVQQCGATRAVEQFAALTYVLEDRFPPYRKWRFRDLPGELPAVDAAATGDIEALDTLQTAVKNLLRPHLSDDRIDNPYLHHPEYDRLG